MEKQRNIPQLRFPEFEREWEKKKLGELSVINPASNKIPDRFIYIDLESVTNGELTKEEITIKDKAPSRAQRVLQKDDILFQMVRPYQKNNLYFDKDGDYVASTGYAQIKTKQNSRYLYQYLHLQKFVDEVIERCTGTSYPAINSKDLAKIYIRFPTLPEQQKIASFFTAIDHKISQLKRKKTLLEQYKKGVMQKIFSQEIRFRDDNGQEFPRWEKKKLGEVYNITSSKRVFQNEWTKSGVPFYRAREIVKLSESGYVDNELFISNEMYDEYKSKYGVPQKNDLLVTGVGTIGVLYVVEENEKFYFKDGNIIWFKSSGSINSQFVKYLFQTRIIRKQLEDNASITTVGTYTIESANKTVVPFPNIKEQTKIANFLSAIDDKINHTRKQIEKAEVWKKGLMQQMFV